MSNGQRHQNAHAVHDSRRSDRRGRRLVPTRTLQPFGSRPAYPLAHDRIHRWTIAIAHDRFGDGALAGGERPGRPADGQALAPDVHEGASKCSARRARELAQDDVREHVFRVGHLLLAGDAGAWASSTARLAGRPTRVCARRLLRPVLYGDRIIRSKRAERRGSAEAAGSRALGLASCRALRSVRSLPREAGPPAPSAISLVTAAVRRTPCDTHSSPMSQFRYRCGTQVRPSLPPSQVAQKSLPLAPTPYRMRLRLTSHGLPPHFPRICHH